MLFPKKEYGLFFVVCVNRRLGYAGLEAFDKDGAPINEDVFLQADDEIRETLGPRGVDLAPVSIANRPVRRRQQPNPSLTLETQMRLTDLDRMLLEVIDGLIPTVYDERGHAIYEAARLDPRLAEAMLCPGESDLQDFTAQERADMSEWIVDSSYEMRTQVETASEYAEPGYSNPESPAGIAFANWNGELEKEVGDILEWLGWELEWSDSWVTCYSCGRAVRSQPDSYAWTAHYYVSDECEKVCFDCVIEYGTQADAYIKGLCGNPGRALTADLDLTGFGFLKVDARWESGYRGGQNDDPREIALKFVELITDQYIFELDSVGQFDCKFSLWVDKEHHTAVQEAISFRNL